MTVIRTDKWLEKFYDQPLQQCEKMKHLFHHASAEEIYHHLIRYGMHEQAMDKDRMETFIQLEVWDIVKKEEQKLKQRWNGPDIPIYIFPAEIKNKRLLQEYNGKSGLSFHDKLFLFISEHNSEQEIRALFTHEYNHVSRLAKVKKSEKNFVLLDLIIMEGLAENAVKEQVGEEFVASWTNFYTDKQLEKIWNHIVLPHQRLPINHPKQQQILYGLKWYPKMAGYCVGYYLVNEFMKKNNVLIKDMLSLPATKIAGITDTNK